MLNLLILPLVFPGDTFETFDAWEVLGLSDVGETVDSPEDSNLVTLGIITVESTNGISLYINIFLYQVFTAISIFVPYLILLHYSPR